MEVLIGYFKLKGVYKTLLKELFHFSTLKMLALALMKTLVKKELFNWKLSLTIEN